MHVKAQGADDRGGVTQVVGAVGRGGPLPYCLCGGAAAQTCKAPCTVGGSACTPVVATHAVTQQRATLTAKGGRQQGVGAGQGASRRLVRLFFPSGDIRFDHRCQDVDALGRQFCSLSGRRRESSGLGPVCEAALGTCC